MDTSQAVSLYVAVVLGHSVSRCIRLGAMWVVGSLLIIILGAGFTKRHTGGIAGSTEILVKKLFYIYTKAQNFYNTE